MPFTRDSLCLSWYIEPTDTDKRHLEMSGVTRVLMPYSLCAARPSVLSYLASRNVRVTIRLDVDTGAPGVTDRLLANLRLFRNNAFIEYLILDNEPENAFDMRYGSPTWGNDAHMWGHRAAMMNLISRLRDSGYDGRTRTMPRLISPAWTNRIPRPSAPPYPGTMRWYITCQETYSRCDGRACHIYTDNYKGPVDLERMQSALQFWSSCWDGPLLIDECGINNGEEAERVAGVLALGDWLLRMEQQAPGAVGTQVDMLTFFANAGDPSGKWWDADYLITHDASYEAMRRWRAG